MPYLSALVASLDLKLISKSDFIEFYSKYINKIPIQKNKDKSGGNYYNNQPFRIGRRFANAVITAAKDGSLLYRDAYKLTGLTAKTFQEFEHKFRTD